MGWWRRGKVGLYLEQYFVLFKNISQIPYQLTIHSASEKD
jgi:hypothetical protein